MNRSNILAERLSNNFAPAVRTSSSWSTTAILRSCGIADFTVSLKSAGNQEKMSLSRGRETHFTNRMKQACLAYL